MSKSPRKAVIPRVLRNHGSRWTLHELTFVENHYGSLSAQEIAEALGRSVNGVRRIISLLGITEKRAGTWTEDEMALLRTHYEKGQGIVWLESLLPHRTRGAITAFASRLGITGRAAWSFEDTRFLKKHYGTVPTEKIAAALGRSVSGVRNAVNVFSVAKKSYGTWREDEMALLRTHYGSGMSMTDVQTLLPGRSEGAIRAQASKMGLTQARSWSPEEDRILRQHYPVVGMKVAEKFPQRTPLAIRRRVCYLGLSYFNTGK